MNEKNKTVLAAMLLGILTFCLRVPRLAHTPDVFVDEIIYFHVINTLATTGNLTEAGGQPWFAHPPMFYIVFTSYFKLTGLSSFGSNFTFDILSSLRLPNCFIASLTTMMLLLLGKKLHNLKTGVLVSLLFSLDQYAIKIDRLALLETIASFFLVLGFLFFCTSLEKRKNTGFLYAGLALGMALITKELLAFSWLVLLFFSLLYAIKDGSIFKKTLVTIFTSIGVYSTYALWGFMTDADLFLETKIYTIKRILGVIIDTGYRLPRSSLINDILKTMECYGITYLSVAISVLYIFYLTINLYFLTERTFKSNCFVASWVLVTLCFFYGCPIWNPQFFHYLVMPTTFMVGYITSWATEPDFSLRYKLRKQKNILNRLTTTFINNLAVIFVSFILVFGGIFWCRTILIEHDDTYLQAVTYIEANIPAGTPIYSDYILAELLPNYEVHDVIPEEPSGGLLPANLEPNIHYFVISPRWRPYMNQEVFDYITQGENVKTFYGRSLERLIIYYVPNPNLGD